MLFFDDAKQHDADRALVWTSPLPISAVLIPATGPPRAVPHPGFHQSICCLVPRRDCEANPRAFVEVRTTSDPIAVMLTHLCSYDGAPGTYVDIVNGVVNNVAIHFAAEKIVGVLLFCPSLCLSRRVVARDRIEDEI